MIQGDLVVCVNAGFIYGAQNNDLDRLKLGDVYTVEDICGRGAGIRVIEVPFSGLDWWHSARFRPCRKTDISALVECANEREREAVE